MKANLETSLQFTAHWEGGYQCLRADAGNWTGGRCGKGMLVGSCRGISAPVLSAYLGRPALPAEMSCLSEATFADIAERHYWRVLCCDALPTGVDLLQFDFGFNAGAKTAVRVLQDVLGVKADGAMGKKTLAAVQSFQDIHGSLLQGYKSRLALELKSGHGDGHWKALATLCAALASAQESHYRHLPAFKTFGQGWITRTEARLDAALDLLRQAGAGASA
ncbi:hypothetical protein E3E12_06105 [Formicincola oecophyllae]|uniref:TtsA-like Glycoside hydrolase family 108 domain-containing protein n=1 Tax=Formicincola oecophyllae TaxID=2558361 RepID=A0A4Y6UB78_9PROT|nr:glycosyl hydrolase 108 family protein [Formicincola oecophyllae]QDH13828.1 hypothetical protein E3E12_06105 [Formicincola oecophyllae]